MKQNARTATRAALTEAVAGRDPEAARQLVEDRETVTHPFYGGD